MLHPDTGMCASFIGPTTSIRNDLTWDAPARNELQSADPIQFPALKELCMGRTEVS